MGKFQFKACACLGVGDVADKNQTKSEVIPEGIKCKGEMRPHGGCSERQGLMTVEEEGLAGGSGGGPGSRRLWGEGSKYDRKGQACWTMTYITPLDAHSFPEKVKLTVLVAELCPTFCDPTNCSLPGSSVPGILQAILRWVASPFSRGSSQPRNQTGSPALQADSLPAEPPRSLQGVYEGPTLYPLFHEAPSCISISISGKSLSPV